MKFKELRKRWTGLGLAFVLSMSAAIPAAADPVDTASGVQDTFISSEASQKQDEFAAEDTSDAISEDSASDSSNSEETQLPEVSDKETETPEDITSKEINTDSTDKESIEVAAENAASETEEKPALELKDLNGDEKTFSIVAKNLPKVAAGDRVLAAVWSDDKGQDDLKWYDLSYSDSENLYKTQISIANHKSNGQYEVHLYIFDKTGSHFIDKNTFKISPVQANTLEVSDVKPDGTALITLSGVTAPSGISEVFFPIWSTSNQSDLVWYKGTKIDNGVYQVKLDIANHSYHYGTYQIHTYGTNGIGCQNFLLKTTVQINRGEISLQADPAANGFTLKASNLDTRDAAKVQFAIWSSNKGQDDLIWLDAAPTTSGIVSKNWVPKEFGEHIIHCYIRTKSGQMIFQKALTVNVKGPKIGAISISSANETGAFDVKLSDVEETSLIKTVSVAVWSDPKQADLVWYTAAKQADGSYSVSGNISKHKYNTGNYQVHVYLTDTNGTMSFQVKDSFTVAANCSKVSAAENSDHTAYTASAENVVVPGGASTVSFAVWSDDKGQDDLVWYNAVKNGSNWSAPIQLSKHISAGRFIVHCYADNKAGTKFFLGATEFTVNLSAKATVSVLGTDEKAGTIDLQIHVDEKSDEIDKLQVPVWVNTDKSDLYTYTANEAGEGNWTVTVKASNHKYHFGTYTVHVDAHFTFGLTTPAADYTIDFEPEKFLSIEKTENGKRLVKISNLPDSVKKVTFPTWSSTGGQDDLVWYEGKKNTDGSWSAEITSANLKHSGNVITHCYVDDVFAGSIESEFTAEEMETVGSRKVHQYAQQLIAANGGDLYRIYKWVVNSYRYTTKPVPVPYPSGYTRQEFYFTDAYETRVTNCFGFAATFYWCAKEMGYDVKLIEGRVRYRSGAYGPHGWVEVYKNGATYICDPELEYEKSINSYMVTYASSPFSYQPTMPAY